MTRYWSYTWQNVARDPLPALMSDKKLHDKMLAWKIERGEEYEAHCMKTDYEFTCPEDVAHHSTWLFANMPAYVVVDKRPITQQEFEAWEAERDRFATEEVAYIRGERVVAPEW